MIIISLLIGLVLGIMIGVTYSYFSNSKPKFQRRGIYDLSYVVNRYNYNGKVNIQYEIGEIESTDTKSKVEVISLVSDQQRFNTPEERKIFKDAINHSWVKSVNIEWIDSKASIRNKKINQVIGK